MHDCSFLFVSRLAVNLRSCDTSGYAGCTGRFTMDSFSSGMMFPNIHIHCRCVILFLQWLLEGL